MVDFLLQHIQDLYNHPNGTKRGFTPLISEENFELIDGPSMNTSGGMIPFQDYDSHFFILPLPRDFSRYLTPSLSHVALLAFLEKLSPP